MILLGGKQTDASTEANARAELLIWLINNGFATKEDVNDRLEKL